MKEPYTIRRLTPALLGDYWRFFDHDAFADNPDWAACYCVFYHADHSEKDWGTRSAAENRQTSGELIRVGRMQGYLAYLGERPVGWCQAAPRHTIRNIRENPELVAPGEGEGVGAIACFLVAQPQRRRGLARQLLEAACQGFREQGLVYAEAYPRLEAVSEAANYHGPLEMYLEAGFEVARRLEGFAVVRKKLV
jgi:GNAT superfamily N-acetyltransferase